MSTHARACVDVCVHAELPPCKAFQCTPEGHGVRGIVTKAFVLLAGWRSLAPHHHESNTHAFKADRCRDRGTCLARRAVTTGGQQLGGAASARAQHMTAAQQAALARASTHRLWSGRLAMAGGRAPVRLQEETDLG